MILKLSGKKIEAKLLACDYIDAELEELNYDYEKHRVTMKYTNQTGSERMDYEILFEGCFTANFNVWLEGIEGSVPQSPQESAFFFHEISIKELEINGVRLYQCKMIIPMMDCLIICKSIAISKK